MLIGKILGNTALAVGQMVVYTGIGLIGLSFTQYKSYLPSVSAGIVWFLAFFLIGFLVIACAWAVAGALASRTEDLQQTAMPLTMLMMAMWFAVFLAKGAVLTVLSFVPPFSAILMPREFANSRIRSRINSRFKSRSKSRIWEFAIRVANKIQQIREFPNSNRE